MAGKGKRSQASRLTWASNYTKWTLEREESSEDELALDWIRTQGGRKTRPTWREGSRTPFILRSIYFESRNERGERTKGGNKEKTYAFVSVRRHRYS